MMMLRRRSRLGATWQVPVLLLVILLGHYGWMAFCSGAMDMDAPAPNEWGYELADPEMGMVSAPVVCSVGVGDCLLSWNARVSPSRSPHVLAPLAVLGSAWSLLEGTASLQRATHALDLPSGIRRQALLQVFRL